MIPYILAGGIFLGLLLAFPKRMAILIGILALTSALVLAAFAIHSTYNAAKMSKLEVTINYDATRCSVKQPLLVTFKNKSTEKVVKSSFDLKGFRSGYSDPIYWSYSSENSTDKIVSAKSETALCYEVPSRRYEIADSIYDQNPPIALNWEATHIKPTFE